MDRGVVSFEFSGGRHVVPVTIGLGVTFEDVTGRGIVAIARELQNATLRLREVAAIIRSALKSTGVDADDDDVFGGIDEIGIMPAFAIATSLVAAVLKGPPKKARGSKKATGAAA